MSEDFIYGDEYDSEPLDDQSITGLPPLEQLPIAMGGTPPEEQFEFDTESFFGSFAASEWGSDEPMVHDANLAQFIDSGALARLSQSVINWVQRDRESRRDWEWREAEGIRRLGMSRKDVEALKAVVPGTEWRSTSVHPGMMKACIQFWARSYQELFPAAGPAKAIVLGATNEDREQQAHRVQGFINYLYNEEMPGAAQEASSAMFRLPMSGSVFRKVYFDPVLETISVRFVESQDFVKPYSAVDLGSAPRYTHIVYMTRNDINKAVSRGYYLNVIRQDPDDETSEHGPLEKAIDDATGQQSITGSGENPAEYDSRDVLYETSVMLDLEDYGWEDPLGESFEDPRTCERISVGLPYLVTVHEGEQRVLSIRRDWRATDAKKRRRRSVIEYKFLPGFGGYGFGLLHIAGGLSDAQTGFLRYLLDGCTLDTVGKFSGYVSQSAVGIRGLPPLQLGQLQPVPGVVDDFRKAIYTPDFQWRTNNTLETLQYLDKLLDFLVASTETMIGDANKDMPVGTILARIEQGSKPFAAIFSLLHASLTVELRAVAEIAADYLDESYPYAVEGEDQTVFESDFDDRVDVVPVSDPNVVSGTQRLAQAQLIMEQTSNLYDRNPNPETWRVVVAAYSHLLDILRIPDPKRFVPQIVEPQMHPQQPQEQDSAAADIARKDAIAQADTQRKDASAASDSARKDAELQAKIDRDAQQMANNSQFRRKGDRAAIAQENNLDLGETEREILQLAAAQKQAQINAVQQTGVTQ